MKYMVKCNFCDSTNLKNLKYVEGKGESFECLDCKGVMSLREIEFKEKEEVSEERCTACSGSGWYDSCDKNGNPIRCGACEGTGFESGGFL